LICLKHLREKRLHHLTKKMGWFVIKNKATGKVLDVSESGDSGAKIIQWSQKNTDNQLWTWIDKSLISKHRGYALDLAESNPAPGTNIIAWHYHGGKNQQWKFENGKLSSLVCLDNCVSVQGHDEWTIQFVGRRCQKPMEEHGEEDDDE
jgi:hypothetical protein